MSELRIVSLSMENVEGLLGRHSFKLQKPRPGEGQLYLLEGANGVGKSSWLHGLLALSSAGHDPRLVSDGAERSVIEMTYVDESGEAAKVTRTVDREGKHPLEVQTDGIKPKQLETWIKQMMGVGFGQNPLDFLVPNGKKADAAKRKERLEYLMRVLDISFPLDELKLHTNGAEQYLDPKDQPKGQNLDIQSVNKLIRDFITIRGPLVTKRDEWLAAAERDRKILVTDDDNDPSTPDWSKELQKLGDENTATNLAESNEVDLIRKQLREKRNSLQERLTAANDVVYECWNSIHTAARAGNAPGVDDMVRLGESLKSLAEAAAVISRAESAAETAVNEQRKLFTEKRTELAASMATARAKWEEGIKLRTIKENMEQSLTKAAALTTQWEKVDTAIKAIEALKKMKLSDMPATLNGLTIGEDDDIYINGRQLDKWNRGEQYIWAMRIASIGTGNFNMIVCDEGEHLDDENLAKVRIAVVKSGHIVFMARRTAGPLRSVPEGALELAAQ